MPVNPLNQINSLPNCLAIDMVELSVVLLNGHVSHVPSLMETTLLSPSLILIQVMVGHWDRSLWNLFHAPSSGKATVTLPSLDSLLSSRISRGMADSNLENMDAY